MAARIGRGKKLVEDVLAEFPDAVRVPGTAVFLFKDPGKAPPALVNNLEHNHVLHENTVVVAVITDDVPRVGVDERAEISTVAPHVHQVMLHFGFMEEPNVPRALLAAGVPGVTADAELTYFVGRESVRAIDDEDGMHPVFEKLYTLLHRGADSASRFFKLPADQVLEIGEHVEL